MTRLLLVVLATAWAATTAAAQEVEFFTHRATSDLDALKNTEGFGLAGRFPLLEWLDVRVALSLRSATSGGIEEVCSQWQPRWKCYDEPVTYESSLQEASVLLLPRLLDTDNVRLAAGGGITLNKMHSSAGGESGRPLAVNLPSGAQRGFVALTDLALSPGRHSAWAFIAGAKVHRAELDGCVARGADIPVVERFCGFYTFKEVRVGVAFRF